jgi:diguanylate cyclase (GGDEF)-like protein
MIAFLYRRSKAFVVALGLVMVAALGLFNLLSGPDVSFLIFYIAPVFLAAWFVGRGAGLWVCLASGLTWVVVAELTPGHYSTRAVPYWNAVAQMAFMVVLTLVFSALKRSHEHEREAARTDHLTGSVNRRHFAELAAGEIGRAQRHGHPFSVAYMDIDNFKDVNDRFGHTAGDELLRSVASVLRSGVRSIDVVARLGGDEFAVLLPETGAAAARTAARRVRRDLLALARARRWPVTYSIGVVTWDAPPASVDEIIKAADDLMYSAKRAGKDRIRHAVYDDSAHAA